MRRRRRCLRLPAWNKWLQLRCVIQLIPATFLVPTDVLISESTHPELDFQGIGKSSWVLNQNEGFRVNIYTTLGHLSARHKLGRYMSNIPRFTPTGPQDVFARGLARRIRRVLANIRLDKYFCI